HLNEPWDSPHNYGLLAQAPRVFRNNSEDPTVTYIQAFTGPGTAFEGDVGQSFEDFPDGLGYTILAAEALEGVRWSAPFDLPSDPNITPGLGGLQKRRRALFATEGTIEGFRILLADGSVKWRRLPIAPETLHALITRNGGESVESGER